MPPNGRRGSRLHHAVDEHRAGLELARPAARRWARSCVQSAAPRPNGESLASRDRVVLVLGPDHRGDRAEGLLVEGGHAASTAASTVGG